MSRNKDIEQIHRITNLPYSECRRILKDTNWKYEDALTLAMLRNIDLSDLGRRLNSVIKDICSALGEAFLQIGENLKSLGQTMKEAQDDVEEGRDNGDRYADCEAAM